MVGKRGNENSQLSKEEYEALQRRSGKEDAEHPVMATGFQRASAIELAGRRIVRAKRPIGSNTTASSSNPFANLAATVPQSKPAFSFASLTKKSEENNPSKETTMKGTLLGKEEEEEAKKKKKTTKDVKETETTKNEDDKETVVVNAKEIDDMPDASQTQENEGTDVKSTNNDSEKVGDTSSKTITHIETATPIQPQDAPTDAKTEKNTDTANTKNTPFEKTVSTQDDQAVDKVVEEAPADVAEKVDTPSTEACNKKAETTSLTSPAMDTAVSANSTTNAKPPSADNVVTDVAMGAKKD